MVDDTQTVDSLDDEIGAMIDDMSTGSIDETPEEVEAEAALAETGEPAGEVEGEAPQTVEEAIEALQAPERWGGQYKEAFNALNNLQGVEGLPEGFDPRGIQQAWLDYHTERQSYATQVEMERSKAMQGLQEFQEVVAPYQQTWDMAGLTPAQGVRQLMGWAGALQKDPQGTIERLAQSAGIDLKQFAAEKAREAEWEDPQLSALQSQFKEMKDSLLAQQQAAVQAQQYQTQTAIDQQLTEFANAADEHGNRLYPDYETLDQDMAGLYLAAAQQVRQGIRQQMPSLQELYEQAAWSNPTVRAKRLEAQAKEGAAHSQAAAAKAATASRSVKSKGTASGTEPALSIDDEVGALIDAQLA